MLGIILVSPWLTDGQLVALGEETPTCVVGRSTPGGRVDAVHIDEQHAAEAIVSHLLARGVSSVGYVAPGLRDDASRLVREQSLARAARRAGLAFTTEEVSDDDAGAAIRRLLSSGPPGTALVAHNDMLAIDAVAVMRERGRAGADRTALVSYDNTYLARRAEFSLTSLDQPVHHLAHEAVRLLTARAAALARDPHALPAPQDTSAAGHLVVRTSSVV